MLVKGCHKTEIFNKQHYFFYYRPYINTWSKQYNIFFTYLHYYKCQKFTLTLYRLQREVWVCVFSQYADSNNMYINVVFSCLALFCITETMNMKDEEVYVRILSQITRWCNCSVPGSLQSGTFFDIGGFWWQALKMKICLKEEMKSDKSESEFI